MKGQHILYSQEELSWIEHRKTMARRDLHAEFCSVWDRADVSFSNLNSLCKRKGWLTGRTGHFRRGQPSHNKGKPMAPEVREKCLKTAFKKGERRGVAVDIYKPIGTERMSKSGYVERKVNDDMPLRARWRAVHLIRWEEINGPVPPGYALKSLDGDRSNTEPSNWELIPRALLPRLAGGRHGKLQYDKAMPEVRPALLAVAKLEHAARELRRRKVRS